MLEKDLGSQGCGQQLKSYIHTPKPQIQDVEPRKRSLGIRTIPCIFGEEKNQEALICFVSVFVYKNVFGKEGKCVENVQAESRTQESLLFVFFQSGGAWGLLQPQHILRGGGQGHPFQMVLDWVDLDTPGKILTSCF